MNATMAHGPGSPAPCPHGACLAQDARSGVHLGRDTYSIAPMAGGFRVRMAQEAYGPGLPQQRVQLILDHQWQPRSLSIDRPGRHHIEAQFHDREVTLLAASGHGRRHMSLPIPAPDRFPLVSGALAMPLFLLMRLTAGEATHPSLLIVPEGICTLRRRHHPERADLFIRTAFAADRLRLRFSSGGALLNYHARNAGLFVTFAGAQQ